MKVNSIKKEIFRNRLFVLFFKSTTDFIEHMLNLIGRGGGDQYHRHWGLNCVFFRFFLVNILSMTFNLKAMLAQLPLTLTPDSETHFSSVKKYMNI